jgi:serine phosphatase RsbU (regulator of sigma subunit)
MDQRILVSQSIVDVVMNKHSSVLISDVQTDSRFKSRDSIVKMNIHSAVCVPLWNNKEIIGIIYSDRISLMKPFTDEDMKLLTLLANLAAVKIENSRQIEVEREKDKMEKELSLAAQIQTDFLPKETPECKGFDIEGYMTPCYQVGGDYYDYIPIGSDRLGVTIADVSGKGVSASLLMASLRASLHSEVHLHYDMEKMAAKLNDFIHKSSSINSFITFFFCELNMKSGELKFVNAGHNPPIVIDKKGKISRMESCGLCLGMFPNVEYKAQIVALQPGDTALLFTDGITESRNKENKEFEEEKLVKFLKKNSKLSPLEFIKEVQAAVETFTAGTEQMDDQTVVVIKKT